MKDALKTIVTTMASKPKTSMLLGILLHFIWIALFFTTRFSNIFLSVIVALIPALIYFMINSIVEEEKDQNALLGMLQVAIVTCLIVLMNGILNMVIPNLGPTIFKKEGGALIPICAFVDFIVAVFVGFTLRQGTTGMFFDNIKKVNMWNALGIHLFDREQKKGDVKLCEDLETGSPVIIPYKDRFLHMLILGPTGSGKTSQSIIPMLNQDVQNLEAGVTVIEPKGDLAEKIYAMSQYYGRPAVYFNPILDACPTFNPLYGKEEDVIENVVTTFNMLDPDSPQYFKDMNEQLLRNALKVLKRLKGNKATMIDLSRLVANSVGQGRKMVMDFSKKPAATEALAKENADIANYFLSDYFAEKSKTYENTSGVRSQIAKIVSNKYLRKVLNPENGKSDIDFDAHLENGTIICICTAQGKLRDLGKFLGYFIILNFQSSVFKRPGNENTRIPHFLYIDEFQTYANPGFADMLTQGRSYRVASHLATQNRALIGMGSGKDGDDFIELVSTNARNVVIYPGGNFVDAKYYSDQFGEIKEKEEQKGITRQRFHPLYGNKVNAPSESIRTTEKDVARYSPTDIIYRKFGEITYAIIQDNTLQVPGIGKIAYIPKELNATLDKMVTENNMLMALNWDPNKYRDFENNGELFPEIDMEAVEALYRQKELEEQRSEYEEEEADIPKANPQAQQAQQAQQTAQPRPQPTSQPQAAPKPAAGPIIFESQTAGAKRSDFVANTPKVDVPPSPVSIKIDEEPKVAKPKASSSPIDDIDDDDII